MMKRKKSPEETPKKREKIESENDEHSAPATQTKHSAQNKENLPTKSWGESEMLDLIKKIEENIPKNDSLSYTRRLDKMNWGKIVVKDFSIKECQEVWSGLLKQVRKFRLLKEIVEDMKIVVRSPSAKNEIIRHPDQPKKPPNSFMFFAEEKRNEVRDKYPKITSTNVAKKLGEMYRKLSPKKREKYELLSSLAKDEYTTQLAQFYEQHPDLVPEKKTKRRKSTVSSEDERGGCPPSRPKTPFQLFLKVEAEKQGEDPSKQFVINRYRERWNEIWDRDKLFWINWAEELFDKYMDDLKEYMKDHPRYEPPNISDILTKNEKKLKARCLGKPDKPPHTGYQLFTKLMLENDEIKRINPREAMSYVSEKWRSFSEEEKLEYKTRVEQMWEEYKGKLNKYLASVPLEERERIDREESSKTRGRVTGKDGKISKPEIPPRTAYKCFLSEYTGEEDPSVVWKNMSYDEKKIYHEKLKVKRRNYIMVYEEYLTSLSKDEILTLAQSLTHRYDTSSESDSEESEESDESD